MNFRPDQQVTRTKALPDNFTTTHKKDYDEKPVVYSPSKRPVDNVKHTGPFNGKSEYQDQSEAIKKNQFSPLKPSNSKLEKGSPFKGNSEYQNEYKKHQKEPAEDLRGKPFRNESQILRSPFKAPNNTEYTDEYIGKPIDKNRKLENITKAHGQ